MRIYLMTGVHHKWTVSAKDSEAKKILANRNLDLRSSFRHLDTLSRYRLDLHSMDFRLFGI